MPDPPTPDQLQMLSGVSADLGAASGAGYHDIVVKELTKMMATYLKTHPNATMPEIASVIGASQKTMSELVAVHGGLNDTIQHILEADQIRPLAPLALQPDYYPIVWAVTTALMTLIVGLRFYSRIRIMGGAMLYDWVMLAGFIIVLGWGILDVSVQIKYEKYLFRYDNTWNQVLWGLRIGLADSILYPTSQMVVKSSILLFYWQLTCWRPFRVGVILTWFFVILGMLCCMFTYIPSCLPVLFWTAWFTQKCPLDYVEISMATGIVTMVTDALIWVLPIPLLLKLQLNKREKIGAVITFGLGAIVWFASIWRIVALKENFAESGGKTNPGLLHIVTTLEANLTVIVASAPALRALIQYKAPKILGLPAVTYQSDDPSTTSVALEKGKSTAVQVSMD